MNGSASSIEDIQDEDDGPIKLEFNKRTVGVDLDKDLEFLESEYKKCKKMIKNLNAKADSFEQTKIKGQVEKKKNQMSEKIGEMMRQRLKAIVDIQQAKLPMISKDLLEKRDESEGLKEENKNPKSGDEVLKAIYNPGVHSMKQAQSLRNQQQQLKVLEAVKLQREGKPRFIMPSKF